MTLRTFMTFFACAAAVISFFALTPSAQAYFGVYYCISFWTLVVADLRANGSQPRPNGFPFEDRFIGYLFTAPFIFPVRLMQLLSPRPAR